MNKTISKEFMHFYVFNDTASRAYDECILLSGRKIFRYVIFTFSILTQYRTNMIEIETNNFSLMGTMTSLASKNK
jgi:hypothetical protein